MTYGGAVQALRGVSLEVADGAVVAVLGSNGAGKSTLLRAISGTLKLHRGTVDPGESPSRATAWTAATRPLVVRRASCRCPRDGGSSPA